MPGAQASVCDRSCDDSGIIRSRNSLDHSQRYFSSMNMKFTKAFTVVAYDFIIPHSKRESEICLLSLADRIVEKSNVITEDV